jgi:DNA polymerase III sliding clamp (beta) subunit (PCNA family)
MIKIKINSKNLLSVLTPLQSVINPGHLMPILQCVKIDIEDEVITVVGDNSEVRCENTEDISAAGTLSICVEFALLFTVLKSLKEQDLDFEVDNIELKIIHKDGNFKVPLESYDTFPGDKKESLKKKAKFESTDFKNALKIANKFVLNDDLSPTANLSIEIGKKTTIRSTNQVSLFQETIKGGGDEAHILLGGSASTAIQSLIQDGVGIKLKYNDSFVFFKIGAMKVMAVQQTGDFPVKAFQTIMSSFKSAKKMKVDYGKVLTAVKRVSSLSGKEKAPTMRWSVDDNDLTITCKSLSTNSEVKENLSVEFKGKSLIGFNPKLIIEILSVFDLDSDFSINDTNCLCIQSGKKLGLIAPMLLDQ